MKRHKWFIFGIVIAVSSIGCQQKIAKLKDEYRNNSEMTDTQKIKDEVEFIDQMTRKSKCTVADAVRAVCILVNGKDIGNSYEERYNFLKNKGIVREQWVLNPDDWIDKGTLAYMLCKAAGIKGGINMRVFGELLGIGDRRYAYRELVYRELIESDGVDYNYVSGPELVTITGKVDRYMEDTGKYHPKVKVELGKEPQH